MRDAYLLIDQADAPVVTPIVRPPLPPWPPGEYQKDLPWEPPHERDYLRADSWGVTIEGMPWVPGASSEFPERVLSWFLDRWTPDWQHKYLSTYAGYGYTHLRLSVPDSLGPTTPNPGGPPGAGQTLAQFVQTCQLVKSYGLYRRVMLGSKNFQKHDMSPDEWRAYADPILDALFNAQCVDEVTPGWEFDLFNKPGPWTVETFKYIGQRCHQVGVSSWAHFSPHVTSWFADGDPRGRFGFWDDLGADVDGIDYQGQAEWDIPELQARLVDTLWQFGVDEQAGKPLHKMRMDEDVAIMMFSHEHPNEDEANQRGLAACCTTDNVRHTNAKIWGAGNGVRLVSGAPI